MNTYSENYKKALNGYEKIMRCIETAEVPEHIEAITRLTENWVNMLATYYIQIYRSRKIIPRVKDARRFKSSCKGMCEELAAVFNEKVDAVYNDQSGYECAFKPTRVKGFHDYAEELIYERTLDELDNQDDLVADAEK